MNMLIRALAWPLAPQRRKLTLIILGAIFLFCCLCTLTLSTINNLGLIPTNTPTLNAIRTLTSTPTLTATDIPLPALTKTPANTPPPTFTRSPANTPKPTINPRCVPASPAQIEIIRIGVQGVEETNNIKSVWAVRSNEFERVWMVAAEITGPEISPKDVIGVWAIAGDLQNPSSGAVSVNNYALIFSDWADGPRSQLDLSDFTDGVQEALECAKSSN